MRGLCVASRACDNVVEAVEAVDAFVGLRLRRGMDPKIAAVEGTERAPAAPAHMEFAGAPGAALVELHSEFEENGFYGTFQEFNRELVQPFQRFDAEAEGVGSTNCAAQSLTVITTVCSRMCASLPNPCRPSSESSRKAKFVFWNVLTFWIGMVDLVVIFVLKSEKSSGWAWLLALVDGLLGYLFAYTFYFIFIAYGKSEWMQWGLWMILAYVLLTAYLTYASLCGPGHHVEMVEGGLNGCKALSNTIVLWHGFKMATAGELRLGMASRVRHSKLDDTIEAQAQREEETRRRRGPRATAPAPAEAPPLTTDAPTAMV